MLCTVQVLLLPEVLNRREERSSAPTNIRRRLFAADDDDVTVAEKRTQFLNSVHEDLENRNRERWNFDFKTETPLPGRYQWAPLCPKAPLRDSNSTPSEVPRAYGQRPGSVHSRATKKVSKTQSKTKSPSRTAKQSKITDFLSHRKRQRTAEDSRPGSKLKSLRLDRPSHSTTTWVD